MGLFGKRMAAAPPPGLRTSSLSQQEMQWVGLQIETAAKLAELLADAPAGSLPSLPALDAVLVGWREHHQQSIATNAVANAVGTAFGEHLRLSTGLAWVIVEDEHGSDLALHGQPGDVLLYPAATVAKRLYADDEHVLEALHRSMVVTVTDVRSSASGRHASS